MQPNSDLPLRPFVFILKEGPEIKANPFDYSLQLLQMQRAEKLRSPQLEPNLPSQGPFIMRLQESIRSPRQLIAADSPAELNSGAASS